MNNNSIKQILQNLTSNIIEINNRDNLCNTTSADLYNQLLNTTEILLQASNEFKSLSNSNKILSNNFNSLSELANIEKSYLEHKLQSLTTKLNRFKKLAYHTRKINK